MTADPLVTLRAAVEADADALFRLAGDVDTWEERNPGPPAPLSRAAFDAREQERADSEQVRFVIEAAGVVVGGASLFGFDRFAGHAEVGIALLPEARGRGIGSAAVPQVVEFGFARSNLRRLHLQAIASNASAIRVYEKAGFVVEGRLREHAWVRGGYEDVVLMGVLRSDWAAADAPSDVP